MKLPPATLERILKNNPHMGLKQKEILRREGIITVRSIEEIQRDHYYTHLSITSLLEYQKRISMPSIGMGYWADFEAEKLYVFVNSTEAIYLSGIAEGESYRKIMIMDAANYDSLMRRYT